MTDASLIEKLRPCPFCPDGGEPYVHAIGNEHTKKRGAEVGCKKCHFSKKVGVVRYSVEWAVNAAIEAWNTRATPEPIPLTEEKQATDWQSMGTAPRDGTAILVLDRYDNEVSRAYWCEGLWQTFHGAVEEDAHYGAWIPCPSLPERMSEGDAGRKNALDAAANPPLTEEEKREALSLLVEAVKKVPCLTLTSSPSRDGGADLTFDVTDFAQAALSALLERFEVRQKA